MGFDFGGAVSGGARAASGLLDQSMREDAEIRAADRKLADTERLLATQEMFKNRAAERFSSVLRNKAGEQVPVEAEAVTSTTADGAHAAGLKDGLVGMTREQVAAYKDPAMLAQYDKQMAADQDLANKDVEGKTRSRTAREAARAAMEDTLMNDPAAYVAGKGMLAGDEKADMEERKLAFQQDKAEKDREQRDRDSDKKLEADRIRSEKMYRDVANSNNRQMQTAAAIALRRDIGVVDNAIRDLERSKKDKFGGEITEINDAIKEKREERTWLVGQETAYFKDSGVNVPERERPPAQTQKPLSALPAGAKQVGTSGGKPVYEVNGKRFIQQ